LFNHWTTPMLNRNNFLSRNPMTMIPRKKYPMVNVKQENELYEMEVAIPGFDKSEILVTVNGDILTIRGEKKKLNPAIDKYVFQEFDYDVVERKFKISEEISKEKIEASYENGILKLKFIDVPKKEESYVKKIKVA